MIKNHDDDDDTFYKDKSFKHKSDIFYYYSFIFTNLSMMTNTTPNSVVK